MEIILGLLLGEDEGSGKKTNKNCDDKCNPQNCALKCNPSNCAGNNCVPNVCS